MIALINSPTLNTLTLSLPQLYSCGQALERDENKVGLLRDSSDASTDFEELRKRFDVDGYLFMKGYLNPDAVLSARAAITDRLASQGLLHPDYSPMAGIPAPDYSNGFHPDIARDCAAVQDLLYGGQLADFYRQFYAEDVRHYDFTWLRAFPPAEGSSPHCDLPYMGRGTHNHMTCWVPYDEISFDLGGLMVLEGSTHRMDLLKNYVYRDVDAYCINKSEQAARAKDGGWTFAGKLSHNPPIIRNKFGGRWLTAEFEPGDFITFGMFLVHASLDNRSENRLRISSDCRYQRAAESIDERWVGPNPPGHSFAGKHGRVC